MQPSKQAMADHLAALVGDEIEGWVEIAYTDPDRKAISNARYFAVDELEDAVDHAALVNAHGSNVYVGAALRRENTGKRAKDADFLALNVLYVDQDNDDYNRVLDACPWEPTFSVRTGAKPHYRAHLYWQLDEPIEDPVVARDKLKRLAALLGTDPQVSNPSRVMRLAGSIAWATKPGREDEVTWHLWHSGVTYPPHLHIPDPPQNGLAAIAESGSTDALLERTREAGQWHQNMRTVTARLVQEGWSDEEIREKCAPYCDKGADDPDLLVLIKGAREKGFDVGCAPADQPRAELHLLDWTAARYRAGEAPEIQWLVEGVIPLGIPGLLAGMGGLGKSYVTLDLALSIARGPARGGLAELVGSRALGGDIAVQGRAIYLSAEDSLGSIHRRLDALDPDDHRSKLHDQLIVVPLASAGGSITIVEETRDGLHRTDAWARLVDQIADLPGDTRLIIIDPLSAFAAADVTQSPASGRYVMQCLTDLAGASGATVLAVHHMRKSGQSHIKDAMSARESILGVGQLVDTARLAYALWPLEEEPGREVAEQCGVDYYPGVAAYGAVVKSNEDVRWDQVVYVRNSAGLLVEQRDVVPPSKAETPKVLPSSTKAIILQGIREAWAAGNPISPSRQSDRYICKVMDLGHSPALVDAYVREQIDSCRLMVDVFDNHKRIRGLRVIGDA